MFTKLTEKKKDLLREFVNHRCQNCKKHEIEVGKLQIHRIKRGINGGLYDLNNMKAICKNCHNAFHYHEF